MPLSGDPEARKRQLANLRPDAALKHGARSEVAIRGRADELFAELSGLFPSASETTLRLQARRLSKLESISRFLEERGEIRNRRLGEPFPVSAMEESLTAAFLSTQGKLEAAEREAGRGGRRGAPTGDLAAELEASRAAWERHEASGSDGGDE